MCDLLLVSVFYHSLPYPSFKQKIHSIGKKNTSDKQEYMLSTRNENVSKISSNLVKMENRIGARNRPVDHDRHVGPLVNNIGLATSAIRTGMFGTFML